MECYFDNTGLVMLMVRQAPFGKLPFGKLRVTTNVMVSLPNHELAEP